MRHQPCMLTFRRCTASRCQHEPSGRPSGEPSPVRSRQADRLIEKASEIVRLSARKVSQSTERASVSSPEFSELNGYPTWVYRSQAYSPFVVFSHNSSTTPAAERLVVEVHVITLYQIRLVRSKNHKTFVWYEWCGQRTDLVQLRAGNT